MNKIVKWFEESRAEAIMSFVKNTWRKQNVIKFNHYTKYLLFATGIRIWIYKYDTCSYW